MSFRTTVLVLLLSLSAAAAGCVSTPADDATGAALDAAGGPGLALPTTEVLEGDVVLSIATPARTLNNQGAFSQPLSVSENATGYVVEVEWAASTPASEQLSVWVRVAGAGALDPTDPMGIVATVEPVAKADGASPLRLALPASAFPETGDYEIIVRASAAPVGVALNQPYTMHLTTFAGVPFDDAFSALGVPAAE